MRSTFVVVLSLLASMLAPPAVAVPPDVAVRKPILLRLEGRFAPDREQASARGANAVQFRLAETDRWFSAEIARTFGGDPPLSGPDVLALLAPLGSSLKVVGDERLRHWLADAPLGVGIRVEGLVDRGSQTYLLRNVTPYDAVPLP